MKPGTRTLMCSFGGGLRRSAVSLRWPADADAAVPGEVDVRRGLSTMDPAAAGVFMGLTLHHVGILTPDIAEAAGQYVAKFGYRVCT